MLYAPLSALAATRDGTFMDVAIQCNLCIKTAPVAKYLLSLCADDLCVYIDILMGTLVQQVVSDIYMHVTLAATPGQNALVSDFAKISYSDIKGVSTRI